MQQLISRMLDGYERGAVSRRQLVQGLAALAGAAQAAPASSSTFQGIELNHIALRVTDIPRSRDFYIKHLGMSVISESSSSCFLNLGRHFLALFRNQTPAMDHYCIAVKDYKVGPVTEELKRQGLNPRQPSGTERVYFPDPDGLVVQLSAVDHRGG